MENQKDVQTSVQQVDLDIDSWLGAPGADSIVTATGVDTKKPEQKANIFSKKDVEWGEKLCIATTKEIPANLISVKLKERFGSHASPKEILKVDEIPYLSIGKPDRKRLANDNS